MYTLIFTRNGLRCRPHLLPICSRLGNDVSRIPSAADEYMPKSNCFKSADIYTMSLAMQKIKITEPSSKKKALESLGYEMRNMKRGRQLSPHLSIYAPELTSMMSISTRFSGLALTLYTWALSFGYLMCSHDMQHHITALENAHLGNGTLSVLKFLIAFPLAYHALNGARHLAWGYGLLLSLREVYFSGYTVLVLTPLLAAWLASL